jgi:hypothetical protein
LEIQKLTASYDGLINSSKRKQSGFEDDSDLREAKKRAAKEETYRLLEQADRNRLLAVQERERNRERDVFVKEMQQSNTQRERDLSARAESNRIDAVNRARFETDRQFEYSASMARASLAHKMNMHSVNVNYACHRNLDNTISDSIRTYEKDFNTSLSAPIRTWTRTTSSSGSHSIDDHITELDDHQSSRAISASNDEMILKVIKAKKELAFLALQILRAKETKD